MIQGGYAVRCWAMTRQGQQENCARTKQWSSLSKDVWYAVPMCQNALYVLNGASEHVPSQELLVRCDANTVVQQLQEIYANKLNIEDVMWTKRWPGLCVQ
jgi:hypothetical protein